MNIPALRQIQEKIRQEPRQFYMSAWFKQAPEIPNCGTAACIAGWAECIKKEKKPLEIYKNDDTFILSEVVQYLGLTEAQALRLFFDTRWPKQFKGPSWTGSLDHYPADQKAELAIARIDHFINTNGEE